MTLEALAVYYLDIKTGLLVAVHGHSEPLIRHLLGLINRLKQTGIKNLWRENYNVIGLKELSGARSAEE